MAYDRPRITSVNGRTIRIAHFDVPRQPKSYLSASSTAGATTETVQDNSGLANNDYIRIGKAGVERTEIVRINGAVTRGTALTTTASVFDHPVGAEVEQLLWNQWRIYGNSTNSSSGATLIATVDMQLDAPYTTYNNTGTQYAFYLIVAYNSNSTTESDQYSDGVARTTGYALNSVGSLIESSLDAAKAKRTAIMTDIWFIREVNDCLRFMTGKLKRWSYLQSFNYAIGQILRGTYSFTLPSDIEDANGPKSIHGVRIGAGTNLEYVDKVEFEEETEDAILTTTTSQALAADTSLNITNSYDYADAGSVDVFVSGTKYTLTYTGVTRSATAGVLTGIPASGTGSITVTIPASTNVWQSAQEGEPTKWTAFDGSLYVWPLADANWDNKNVFLDYYTARTEVNSAGDVIEGPRYDAVKHWLIAKVRAQSAATGKMDPSDPDWGIFREILSDLVRREISGQRHPMKPRINQILY